MSDGDFPYRMVFPVDSVLSKPYLCDDTTNQGGWVIIQRRVYGNEDFNRSWADYRAGFGDRMRDFWMSNEDIFALTSLGRYELRMEVLYKKMEVCQICQLFHQQRENNVQARPGRFQWYRRGLLRGKTQRSHVQYF